jgi:hypothetical protein
MQHNLTPRLPLQSGEGEVRASAIYSHNKPHVPLSTSERGLGGEVNDQSTIQTLPQHTEAVAATKTGRSHDAP